MIEKQIAHCKELVDKNGLCDNVNCYNCPARTIEKNGCWDPDLSSEIPSEIVVTKAKEFLIENKAM